MLQYTFPKNYELMAIEPDLVKTLTMNDSIFQHFPIKNLPASSLRWEVKDSARGLQNIRGLNGDPSRVVALGSNMYSCEPGVYGEFRTIDEQQLTERAGFGQVMAPIDVTDLVRDAQDQLLGREIDLIRYVLWKLLVEGKFSIVDARGQVQHTAVYDIQTASAAVVWSLVDTATPLQDFRNIQLLSRGSSTSFGAGSVAYMNRATFNEFIGNHNAHDLQGQRVTSIASPLNLAEANKIMAAHDLPTIEINDEGYIDDAGTFQLFIPNDKVVIVGKRTTGEVLGNYLMTRNANNEGGAPGSYIKVVDSSTTGTPIPRKIEVHRGHNGGPVIYRPKGVVVLSV